MGWQRYPWGSGRAGSAAWAGRGGAGETFELEKQTEAWNEARRLALGRLREEARLAGADAVVGVRLRAARRDWATGAHRVRRRRHRRALGALRARGRARALEPVRPGLRQARRARLLARRPRRRHDRRLRRDRLAAAVAGDGRCSPGGRTRSCPTSPAASTTPARWRWSGCSEQAHELHAHGVVGVTVDRSEHARRARRRRHELHRPHHRACTSSAPPSSRSSTTIRRRTRISTCQLNDPRETTRAGAEEYDPTSTAGVPEHGIERLARMRDRTLLHERPLGQRVPARQGRRLRAARPRRRDVDLPHRLPGRGVEPEPGDGRPDPGDVPRPRARDDAHGGGGRPARRRRDRRRAARRQPPRVGRRPRRVHRHRHRRAPPRGRAAPRAQRPARSRATSRARTSTR